MESVARARSLDASVLVLNRSFVALHVISARRAFCLLFKQLAEVIAIEDNQYNAYTFQSWREVSTFKARFENAAGEDEWVHTVNFEILVPRIIRLVGCDRRPRNRVKFNRRNLFARDGSRCQYCGKAFSTSELTLDHVVPRSRGGQSAWENVVCACVRCNAKKGGRLPHEAGMRLVARPHRPRTCPTLSLKLSNAKYRSWKQFIDHAYWDVELT